MVCTCTWSSNIISCKIKTVSFVFVKNKGLVCGNYKDIPLVFLFSMWRTFVYHKTFVAIARHSFVVSYN